MASILRVLRFRSQALASIVICVFTLSAMHVTTGAPRTCAARCPIDCPMHVKKLHCHEHPGDPGARAGCHRQARGLPGVQSAGCHHHAPDAATPDQLAVLVMGSENVARPPQRANLQAAQPPLADITVDPPFHPPPLFTLLS